MTQFYKISNLQLASDAILLNDIYLILLYATRVPPHLLISVHGKIFTLSVKGATVDGELSALLHLIQKKNIETVFIRLALPQLFTIAQLKNEIRECTLAYPRADIGIATCLTPIRDFCHSVYDTEATSVNLIFDLLPRLQERNAIKDYHYLNLDFASPPSVSFLPGESAGSSFLLKRYEVYDVYDAIRKSALVMA